MAEKLYMIALSPTMTEGTLSRWKVAEGQAFKAGSVLCEVETDKAAMDYEAPKDGSLLKILLAEGGRAAVGDVIGIIGKAGESPDALLAQIAGGGAAPAAEGPAEREAAPAQATSGAEASAPANTAATAGWGARNAANAAAPAASGPGGSVPSSPLARVLAAELGLDIRSIRGTGPGGRVIKRDVEAAASGAAPGSSVSAPRHGVVPSALPVPRRPQGEQTIRLEPVTGKRAVIARRLSESFFSAPHYYL